MHRKCFLRAVSGRIPRHDPPRARRSGAELLLLVWLAGACEQAAAPEDGPETKRQEFECGQGGTILRGTMSTASLRAADSPHHLRENVFVTGSLTVEAGALVCASPGVSLTVLTITALGTEREPIVFTAADSTAPWGGIRTSNPYNEYAGPASWLEHVTIEHALVGFHSWDPVHISNATIRQIQGVGIHAGLGHIADTNVESACLAGGCAAIRLGQYGAVTLERVQVENSGAVGITTARRSRHVFRDVDIIGSQGIGLSFPIDDGDFQSYTFEGTIRITGGANLPASMMMPTARRLLALSDAEENLRGNARDLIEVYPGVTTAIEVTISRRLGWRLHPSSAVSPAKLVLKMEAGSVLELPRGSFEASFRIDGSEAEPAVITGPARFRFWGDGADTSHIRNARLQDLGLHAHGEHVLLLENVEATNVAIELLSSGSRLSGVSLQDGPALPASSGFWPLLQPDSAMLTLGASTRVERSTIVASALNGVLVRGADVRIEQCAVTRSAGDGIRVSAGEDVIVRDCEILENDGLGLNNVGEFAVDARDNWWGSASGPGTNGANRVGGNVLFEPFRTAPISSAR